MQLSAWGRCVLRSIVVKSPLHKFAVFLRPYSLCGTVALVQFRGSSRVEKERQWPVSLVSCGICGRSSNGSRRNSSVSKGRSAPWLVSDGRVVHRAARTSAAGAECRQQPGVGSLQRSGHGGRSGKRKGSLPLKRSRSGRSENRSFHSLLSACVRGFSGGDLPRS